MVHGGEEEIYTQSGIPDLFPRSDLGDQDIGSSPGNEFYSSGAVPFGGQRIKRHPVRPADPRRFQAPF